LRNYSFTWTGEWSFSDIGRYTAEATLAYGETNRQFVTTQTAFWVLPWRILLGVFLVLGTMVWLIIRGIKLYIRRMLQIAGVTPELQRTTRSTAAQKVSVTAPLEEGILDLRSRMRSADGSMWQQIQYILSEYRLAVIVVLSVVTIVSLFVWYLVLALTGERGYQVSYEENGQTVQLETPSATEDSPAVVSDTPAVAVINRSGIAGLDELAAIELRAKGYEVAVQQFDIGVKETNTVIVYDPEYADQILQLQSIFADALVSSYVSTDDSEPKITIYVGADQIE